MKQAPAKDWSKFDIAASEARQAEKDAPAAPHSTDFARLDARRIDLSRPPKKPVPTFKLRGYQICTAGNVTTISAQAKAGKSAVIGAMLAAVAVAESGTEGADCLGFEAHPHNGKAVILFDTEQSDYDSHMLVKRATQRAGVGRLADNCRCYRLLDLPTVERRRFLAAEMERASAECGGIHCVLVDGVADLCIDPNDCTESFGLVEELVRLAVQHDCPIVAVLHENPSQMQGGAKTRGHLGSQLERKSESNLRVVKKNEVSVIFSERCRSAHIPKQHGAQFAWCDAAQMHVSVPPEGKADTRAKKRAEIQPVIDAVFEGTVGALKFAELMERMKSIAKFSTSTAQRRIKEGEAQGLIKRASEGIGYLKA